MTRAPVVATALLTHLVAGQEPVIGDLLEEYRAGRSRAWYWRQVLGIIATGSVRAVGAHPWLALRAIAMGWAALLLVFAALGDVVAGGLASLLWDWDRESAWVTSVWWPFQITAALMSYGGFAGSAWLVARLHRQHAVPMLFAFIASMLVVLALFAAYLEWRAAPLAVPHPLFYIVAVSLPSHWRSGFVLMPLVTLISGLAAAGRLKPAPTYDPLQS